MTDNDGIIAETAKTYIDSGPSSMLNSVAAIAARDPSPFLTGLCRAQDGILGFLLPDYLGTTP